MKPVISILMPSYNHASFVEGAVRSAMEQKNVSFELLVIDDGSTDESPHILKKLSEELGFYFLARENKGLIQTLNELAAIAKGKYIRTLASDDIMPPNSLKEQLSYMEANPEAPACFGQVKRIFPNGKLENKPWSKYLKNIPYVSFGDLFTFKKEIHGCSEFIRRSAFDSVGGYSSKFKIEDFPLWLALSSKYGNLPVIPNVIYYHRIHANEKNMHKQIAFIHNQFLEIIAEYKQHELYAKSLRNLKSGWFSCLAYSNKKEAFLRLPEFFSFSWVFFRRFPKLFIPKRFLKY
ncbi:MAG: glycosyltransferase [Fibromonadaceae bacterium]|jgi:glycosyltransferase involved in cell wall biosynthesis|nr:glycosyltransferase [Fibromonadaceae bacterium]